MKTYNISLDFDQGIKFEQFVYPGGESQVRLTKEAIHDLTQADEVRVQANRLGHHFMDLALLTDAIKEVVQGTPMYLILPYLPYSRADRRFVDGDCLGLKVFGDLINSLGYDKVVTIDAHSGHARRLIANLINISPEPLIKQTISKIKGKVEILLPDKGSQLRYGIGSNYLYCDKIRDVKTGVLSGFTVPPKESFGKAKSVLIIDDICDGGRTFTGIADKLANYNLNLYLYVTHGIFSNGFNELNMRFKKIFTSDSLAGNYIPGGSVEVLPTDMIVNKALRGV